MIYVFIHQNFPGQYRHLIRTLADQGGNTIYCITQKNGNHMVGATKIVYDPEVPTNLNCHSYTMDFDMAVRNAVKVAEICNDLRARGVKPDIIIGHNGWGELMFVKDVFVDTPVLIYFEYFYHARNVDVDFDHEHPAWLTDAFRLRARNAVNLLSMDVADWGNTPTMWQRSLQPPEIRPRLSVIHEGVDTDVVKPDPDATFTLWHEDITLTTADEVVTYVSRNLEPYRGFHIFMRAAREILKRRPNARIIVVGGDAVSYGAPAPDGATWRALSTREIEADCDMSRIHFLGQIAYQDYLRLLQVSSVHIYLTYPFVLSWSFIEAMAAGCAIIGSATPPVIEVLQDGVNGLAVDFFSPLEIADRVDEVLDNPAMTAGLRAAARATAVEQFDLNSKVLPRWLALLDDIIAGRRPNLHLEHSRRVETN